MRFALLLPFLLTPAAHAAPDCLEGFWDLGPRVAAAGITCPAGDPSLGAEESRLFFCKREVLLENGICTGRFDSITCRWQEDGAHWVCEQSHGEHFRFRAELRRLDERRMHYKAKSNFADVDLVGAQIPLP